MIYFIASIYLAATFLTFVLAKLSYKLNIIDIPNQRSMHTRPVPRTGGLAIILTFIGAMLYLNLYTQDPINPSVFFSLYLSTALISTISFIDDCCNLAARYRLAVQVVAALGLLYYGLNVHVPYLPSIITSIFSFLFIVWLTNLYNFMDGLDGFASGMTAIGYGTLAIILFSNNQPTFGIINLIICVAALGVLTFNFPPAKIFLGDVGSTTIGFFTAGMSIILHNQEMISLWQSMLIFSPFIIDATVTILKRLYNKEPIFQPHRSHYYQKMALLIGKKKTLLLSYIIMSVCSFTAIMTNKAEIYAQQITILYVLIVYSILITSMEIKISKSKDSVPI